MVFGVEYCKFCGLNIEQAISWSCEDNPNSEVPKRENLSSTLSTRVLLGKKNKNTYYCDKFNTRVLDLLTITTSRSSRRFQYSIDLAETCTTPAIAND